MICAAELARIRVRAGRVDEAIEVTEHAMGVATTDANWPLVGSVRTNREIAAELHRSPKTVANQLNSAMRKLGVSSRTALAVRATETR